MNYHSYEEEHCAEYLSRSEDEHYFEDWDFTHNNDFGLVLTEGFEERTLGILEKIGKSKINLPAIAIGRYVPDIDSNRIYRARLEELAELISKGNWRVFANYNDGRWVSDAINFVGTDSVLLDITSISNRGLFGAFDAASMSGKKIFIGYTEAGQYWPKRGDWQQLKEEIFNSSSIAEIVDKKPWLFGYEHHVELIPGHEGRDSAGCRRALVGFLAYKCARLGSILGKEDYSEFFFIAGRPRLEENSWRLEALKDINEPITKDRKVIEIRTFKYRKCFERLTSLLFQDDSLFLKYNVHLAILGSKLQTAACWALSSILTPITVVTSIPAQYFPASFSEGVGVSWFFRLTIP